MAIFAKSRFIRASVSGLAALLIGWIGSTPPSRAGEPVDLELVIAVDVSFSVDEQEARLQREGYIAAFLSPVVVNAIRSGYHAKIAVTYFEWAGMGYNRTVADWTLIHDAASARAFAETLAAASFGSARRTSLSEAIDFAKPRFEQNAYDGRRRVIDVSGDGANNWGRSVVQARDEAVAAGITINGLPIVSDRPDRFSGPSNANLDAYYETCVIGGQSAFMVVAKGFEDFGQAIRKKLILEIAGATPADIAEATPVSARGLAPPARRDPAFRLVAERPPIACDQPWPGDYFMR